MPWANWCSCLFTSKMSGKMHELHNNSPYLQLFYHLKVQSMSIKTNKQTNKTPNPVTFLQRCFLGIQIVCEDCDILGVYSKEAQELNPSRLVSVCSQGPSPSLGLLLFHRPPETKGLLYGYVLNMLLSV